MLCLREEGREVVACEIKQQQQSDLNWALTDQFISLKQMQEAKQQSQAQDPPEGQYFQLIEAVGSSGKYQTAIIVLTCILCFQNGFVSLGTPYFFAVAPYTNCPAPYSGVTECTKFACAQPQSQRAQYQQPQIRELSTLGNEFGDYHCQLSDIVESAKGAYYFGGIVGVVVTSSIADNIGRRSTLLLSLVLGVIGHLTVQLSQNLVEAEVGMSLVGFCLESSYNLSICFLTEILNNSERQTKVTLIQALFSFAGIAVVIFMLIFKSWRIIYIIVCLVPLACCLVFSYFFVQQTPQFLIKRYSVREIRKSFKFIARVNDRLEGFEEKQLLSQTNIQRLKQEYRAEIQKEDKQAFTYIDLFRYNSLRKVTIFMCLLFVAVNILYYAPIMLIDQFGFDFYLNGIIVNSSEFVTYFVTYFTIRRIKRRKFNIVGSLIVLASSITLIFLHAKQICTENCSTFKVFLELLMVFIMRFFASILFQILFVYIPELYPIQVVGLGIGLTAVAGAIPVMFIPQLINVIDRSNFPVMAVFSIVAILYLFSSLFLKETRGLKPQDKIKEIQGKEVTEGNTDNEPQGSGSQNQVAFSEDGGGVELVEQKN